ncbi:DnaD domain protein [Halarsenatibacter silvermanii]|uniref:Replication initiation and membrane attachment n=1 Tax=Halarsenatibacter silvermanii TaxID=321763 RepID=A0A1G9RR65_9FIRM|nr:DnaD domain protein [Halarsenatibacter silvermanii]SDM24965.1 Replication initiation and membrane attachment [Halarsenatibacter silvermanii]
MNSEKPVFKLFAIPEEVLQNQDLNTRAKIALVALWSQYEGSRHINISPGTFTRLTSLPPEGVFNALNRLDDSGWIELIDYDADRKIELELARPAGRPESFSHGFTPDENESASAEDSKTDEDFRTDPDQKETAEKKLISAWRSEFPGRQLTPGDLTHLQAYLERGMDAELLIEIIKYTAGRVRGNPLAYMRKILNDLHSQNITSKEGFWQHQENFKGESQDG